MSNSVCVFLSWFKKRREGHTDSHPFRVIKNLQYMCQNESQIERLGFLWRMLQPLSGSKSKCPIIPQQKDVLILHETQMFFNVSVRRTQHRRKNDGLTVGHKSKPTALACFYPVQWGLTTFDYFFFLSFFPWSIYAT